MSFSPSFSLSCLSFEFDSSILFERQEGNESCFETGSSGDAQSLDGRIFYCYVSSWAFKKSLFSTLADARALGLAQNSRVSRHSLSHDATSSFFPSRPHRIAHPTFSSQFLDLPLELHFRSHFRRCHPPIRYFPWHRELLFANSSFFLSSFAVELIARPSRRTRDLSTWEGLPLTR